MDEDHLDLDAASNARADDPVASLPDMLDGRAAELADEAGALLRRALVSAARNVTASRTHRGAFAADDAGQGDDLGASPSARAEDTS